MLKLFKNRIVFFVAIMLVVAGIAYGLKSSEKSEEKNLVLTAVEPVAGFFSGVGYWFDDKFDFFLSIGGLKTENEQLLKENLKLKSEIAKLKDVFRENESLRKQLELAPRSEFQLEDAMVVGRGFDRENELLYISKGSKDGIKKGMPVIVGEGVLIGKVLSVFAGVAEVELVISREIKVNAEIQESEAKGIVHGEYGTSVVMDMIPQTVEVNSGDSVITSGLGGEVPRGLLVGYAKQTAPTADQLFQKTTLALPADMDKIRAVSVIKNTK